MLYLDKPDADNHRILRHGPDVFHKALEGVMKGEFRFTVTRLDGECYDLVYKENNSYYKELNPTDLSFPFPLVPPYYTYDEDDVEKLDLCVFEGYSAVLFESVNEYTVTLARILLRDTDLMLYFSDPRILWFLEQSDRLVVSAPEGGSASEGEGRLFTCCREFNVSGAAAGDISRISAEFLFHNVFFLQWLTELPLAQMKYAVVNVLKPEGIGAVLDHFQKMRHLFGERGIKTYLRPGCTQYSDDMLRQFFCFEPIPEDVSEENTIFVHNFLPLRASIPFYKSSGGFTEDMLNRKFADDIREYYDAVFGQEKVLGVLIRGTDYVNLKMEGARRQGTPEEMIERIDAWMKADGYDRIFLATEDQDVLDVMRRRYGDKLRAVSQVRHSVREFKKGEFLADLYKRQDADARERELYDTTANYFYALVILSKCTSFLASGQSNGWEVVCSLNGGRFLRCDKFRA